MARGVRQAPRVRPVEADDEDLGVPLDASGVGDGPSVGREGRGGVQLGRHGNPGARRGPEGEPVEAGRGADERLVDDLVAVVGPVRGDGKRAVERDPALVLAVVVHDVELFVPTPVAVGAEDDPRQEGPGLSRELPDDVVGDDVRHTPDRGRRRPSTSSPGSGAGSGGRGAAPRRRRSSPPTGSGCREGTGRRRRSRRRPPRGWPAAGTPSGGGRDRPGRTRERSRGRPPASCGRDRRARSGRRRKPGRSRAARPARSAGLLPARGRGRCRSAARAAPTGGGGCCPESGASDRTSARVVTSGSKTHRGPPAVLHWKRMWTPSSSRRNSGGRGGSGLAE